MNSEDARQVRAERDASPVRFESYAYNNNVQDRGDALRSGREEPALNRVMSEEEYDYEDDDTSSIELQEIRTQPREGGRGRIGLSRTETMTSQINKLERHPTALERIDTHRVQHEQTVGYQDLPRTLSRTSTGKKLPNFGAGKPYPHTLPEQEEYVVEFDGHDDPLHAQNWPMKKKVFVGIIVAFDSLAATMGSSIFSATTGPISIVFGVSREVAILGTSLFVLGYAFGPIMWAPMSELYGRRIPILISGFGFSIFSIGVATAENLQTVMLCRFFAGTFGSCPLAVVGAIFADMFDNKSRGLAIAVFSVTIFMGPLLAPFIGGFITISYLGWRWTEYISAIMGFTALVLCVLFLEETYPPVILVGKASELRRRTKNWGIHAKQEEVEVDLKELLTKNVSRPFRILFTEPIVLSITIYMSFIYGLLYLFLTAYAEVFQGVYGMNEGVGGLPYFGMVAGETIGFIVVVLLNPSYVRKLEANNNVPVPEWRIPIAIVGGVAFAAGLFWFGWTGYTNSIPWIVPTLSGLLTGFGIFTIFLQLLNYIIDAYLMFAASAIAANTFLRSLFGCVFPLFATYMFDGLGINYTLTLLGGVAVLLVPLPIIFYIYGKKIRANSKIAPGFDLKMAKKDEESSGGSANGSRRASGEAAAGGGGGGGASLSRQGTRVTGVSRTQTGASSTRRAEQLRRETTGRSNAGESRVAATAAATVTPTAVGGGGDVEVGEKSKKHGFF